MTRAKITTCVTVRIVQSHGGNKVIDVLYSVWSNFEIADMDFWRSEAYMKFFEYLEATGGFYYEVTLSISSLFVFAEYAQRWGDAPVHSIAAALFARKDQLHFFKDIGKLGHMPFEVSD